MPVVKHQQLYEEFLEEVTLAEKLGYDSVWLSEHHFESQGYCPSILVAAGAAAARTDKVKIGTGALILPLHDPIRVAEDAAVADLFSGGRM
ncbi:MAG: LLM class flavin-dependent oxidoreductase, partial [Candidatus Bathyarchaeia archaeon]